MINNGNRDDNPEFVEIQTDDDSIQMSELEMSLGSFPAYVGARNPSEYVPPPVSPMHEE